MPISNCDIRLCGIASSQTISKHKLKDLEVVYMWPHDISLLETPDNI